MIALFQRSTVTPDLRAGTLRLVAITPEMLHAEQAGKTTELGQMLRARITEQWPPVDWEPHVYEFILKQYEEHPQSAGWHRYVVTTEAFGMNRTLVGAVGAFPKGYGDAEMGYSTLPEFQRRGYATSAAKALVEYLLCCEGVTSVSACTFPRLPESIKVMERCGLTYVGAGDEDGTVKYRRLRQATG